MAIPVSQFPILSFEQANPALVGVKYGTDIYGDILKNYQQQTQNQFLPQNLQAQLDLTRAQTPFLQAQTGKIQQEMPYYGPKMAEDIQEAIARSGLYGSESGKIQQEMPYYGPKMSSDIKEAMARSGLYGAQAGLATQEAKYLPLKDLISATQVSQTGSRFGDAYQFARILQSLPAEQRSSYISAHPHEFQDTMAVLGNKTLQQQASLPQTLLTSVLQKYFGPASGMQPNTDDMQSLVNSLQGQQQPNAPQPNAATPTQLQPGVSPSDNYFGSSQTRGDMANAFIFGAARKNSSATVNNRAQNAIALERWLIPKQAEYAPRINNAIQYAGLLGRGQKVSDEWLNQHPNAIADYDWYTNTFTPFLKNGIKYLEQMGATDQQRGELEDLVNVIDKVKSNPQRAATAINRYVSTMQDVANGVFDAAEPQAESKGIYRKMYKIPGIKGNYLDVNQKSAGAQQTGQNIVRIQDPDGQIWRIPSNRVADAVKAGGKVLQ